MSETLKLSISGVRGIWGESLTKEVVLDLVRIFIQVTGARKIVIGTDTRVSRQEIFEIIRDELVKCGCTVIDCGIIATPTLAFTVRDQHHDAGIMITASHNPGMWNGMKFFTPEGMFISPETMEDIMTRYHAGGVVYHHNERGSCSVDDTACQRHVDHIVSCVDTELIASAQLRIVGDPGNGAGVYENRLLCQALGVAYTGIHETTDGNFERHLEPLPEYLSSVGEQVRQAHAHFGFAQDPDADRLALIDEQGIAVGEEYTLALATQHALQHHIPEQYHGSIVTNLSTSQMVDDIAREYGISVIRTNIGEIHVAQKMKDTGAFFGGEGNGGVIWPQVSYVRDSFAGLALICEMTAYNKKKFSAMIADMPQYVLVKDKKTVTDRAEIATYLAKTKQVFSEFPCDETDGVKIIFGNGWLHVRPSNTEPIIRIFAEAPSAEQATAWIHKVIG